jgi:hypothetical protein
MQHVSMFSRRTLLHEVRRQYVYISLLHFVKEKTQAYEATFISVSVCPLYQILKQMVDIYKVQ